MNFFPDQLNTVFLGFSDPGNVFETERDAHRGTTTIRCVIGPAAGYEAICFYNGRLLIGFQEVWGGYNEKLDFIWEAGSATATSSTGLLHELKCDARFNPIAWCIRGRNAQGYDVVLRYLRNFFDANDLLFKSIRYEENAEECHRIYQYFEYGLDDQTWKARRAFIYDYPYALGNEEYWHTEIPVDILAFPSDFQENALEVRQLR